MEARAPRKCVWWGGVTPFNGLYGEAPPKRGAFSDFKYVTKKRFEKLHSSISFFFKNTITLFVVPPKFCISITFNFFWGDFSQEKLLFYYFFWGGEGRGKQGVLWEMCKWRILFWGRHFFFYLFSIYSIIYLFIYLLSGYWAMYVLQNSAQLTYQLEHVVTLVR